MATVMGLRPLPNLPNSLLSSESGKLCTSKAAFSYIGGRLPVLRSGKLRRIGAGLVRCSGGGEVSVTETAAETEAQSNSSAEDTSWVPVVPVSALPKGERRLIRQDGQTILLLWYKNDVFAIENKSPAEGAFSEGLFNARLTPDGCVVCPSTSSTFDLKTGQIKDWYPTNAVMKLLLKPTRELVVYPVKMDPEYIYINMQQAGSSKSAEIVFSGRTNAGRTASDINIEEVRMVLDDDSKAGFGFTPENEITNGRAAMVGFSLLLIFELTTGKGLLKGTGFLDFLYQYLKGFPLY